MPFLVAVVFALFCIDVDTALPVPGSSMITADKWNFLLLGGISVIGMGAILACVRCRRKKRGFEEFKNEATKATRTATTVEAIRTEFPIFQALSTPSSPQFQKLDNDSSRDSRDDLHYNGERMNHVDMLDEIVAPPKVVAQSDAANANRESAAAATEEEKYLEKAPRDALVTDETFDPFEGVQMLPGTIPHQLYKEETQDDEGLNADEEFETRVELALRELDIAIGGDLEDEEDDHDEDVLQGGEAGLGNQGVVDDEEHLENVLRQLFIGNMLSGLTPTEELEQQLPIENVIEQEENEGQGAVNGHDTEMPIEDLPMTRQNTTIVVHPDVLDQEPEEEEENFFNDLPAICQSTPSVRVKREAVTASDYDNSYRPTAALFNDCDCEEEEQLSPNGEGEGTFVVPQVVEEKVCQERENDLVDVTFEVKPEQGVASESSEKDRNYLKDNNATITPVNTPIEVTFDVYQEQQQLEDETRGEGEMTFTKDLDCFDVPSTSAAAGGWFLHPQEAGMGMGDETFDYDNLPPPPPPIEDDYYGTLDDDEGEAEWGRSRGATDFDALRKQLADLLPHAQGAPALDDEGAVGGSCESGMSASVLEAMLNNIDPSPAVVVEPTNYKRPLSPIMEESEEENTTIKTSILIDTKNLDSMSTGCIEDTLSEAVMGVTRTLMASNDTLFNFSEDTLGDRDDLTPTPTASGSGGAFSAALSPINNPRMAVQALNETFTMPSADQKADSTFVMDAEAEQQQHQQEKRANKLSMSLDLTAVRADTYTSALDVLSPEQQKTFSEDITASVEHVSGSDASGNMDPDGTYTTNTIEMETCISLNRDEDEEEGCDLVEDLEKDDRASGSLEDSEDEDDSSSDVSSSDIAEVAKSTINMEEEEVVQKKEEEQVVEKKESPHGASNGVVSEEMSELPAEDPLEQTKLFLAREIDYNRWHKVSCVDAAVFHVQTIIDHVPVLDMEAKCITSATIKTNGKESKGLQMLDNVTFDLNENYANGGDNCLSGEEDPWGTDSRNVSGESEEMVTVFNSEWNDDDEEEKEEDENSDNNPDSEEDGQGGDEGEEDGQSVDSSDSSSEEFMYVGGNNLPSKGENGGGRGGAGGEAWESHVDQVPIGKKEIDRKFETVTEEDEEEEGAVAAATAAGTGKEQDEEGAASDGEFIPSSWNSHAKPRRSAMKSPDKSSSGEKRRPRNVAFKKQQYHSVYEYPREMNPLSPSLSEPTFSINFRDQVTVNAHSTIGDIDGFMISSSTRPFQGNQCNTWPTESDFSWSQHMPDDVDGSPGKTATTEGTVVYSEIPIEWPRKVVIPDGGEGDDSGSESNPVPRPDSGVGESAEFLNDPVGLGELCHTKASLRLPLVNAVHPISAAVNNLKHQQQDDLSDEELRKESSDDNMGLPTPSCTGSMDSLSSSSCSDRQMTSFTTFGKVTPQSSLEETSHAKLTVSHDSGHGEADKEEEMVNGDKGQEGDEQELNGTGKENNSSSKRISDSTDEDSGIENISRRMN